MNRLKLHIPSENELEYRRQLIADEVTMEYNMGYGDDGGCIYQQTEEQVRQWYQVWNKDNEHFYAYIVRTEDNTYIGEVNAHKNNISDWYEMGIVLETKYRGMGYAVEAWKLLLKYAFETLGAQVVHNDFEETRTAAVRTHLSAGFTEYAKHDGIIKLLITKEQYDRQNAIDRMVSSIQNVLSDNPVSIYLYGSAVLGDFRLGWSDIDILCLTEKTITEQQADELITLRQILLEAEPDNPYYRSFEGGILPYDVFLNKTPSRVVYWGTSGQCITDRYHFDSFSMVELLCYGKLLRGTDVRQKMLMPTYEMLVHDVKAHYDTIRKYAVTVGRNIKSYGWLLDISRCIYTLRTGDVIAKTAAGEWALENGVCPVEGALEKAIMIRKEPLKYTDNVEILSAAGTLGGRIQKYADVLEAELKGKS